MGQSCYWGGGGEHHATAVPYLHYFHPPPPDTCFNLPAVDSLITWWSGVAFSVLTRDFLEDL